MHEGQLHALTEVGVIFIAAAILISYCVSDNGALQVDSLKLHKEHVSFLIDPLSEACSTTIIGLCHPPTCLLCQ